MIGALRGSLPPIGMGPSVEEGARPGLEGGANDPSITESTGGSTYHTAVPWLGGVGTGRPCLREAGPCGSEPIHWTVRGQGRGHRARPKHTSSAAASGPAAPPPSGVRPGEPPPLPGTPTFAAQRPRGPSFAGGAGGARRRLPGSARRLFSLLPSRATRFSSFSVNNSWVAGGGGKVAPAESGRAPPTHPRAAVGAGGWRL